jgi:hypothetical protein
MDELIPANGCWKNELDVTPHFCCDWHQESESVTPMWRASGYDTCWDFNEDYMHKETWKHVRGYSYTKSDSPDPFVRLHGFDYYDEVTCCPHYQTSRGRTSEFIGIDDVGERFTRAHTKLNLLGDWFYFFSATQECIAYLE